MGLTRIICGQGCQKKFDSLRERIQGNWKHRKVQILSSTVAAMAGTAGAVAGVVASIALWPIAAAIAALGAIILIHGVFRAPPQKPEAAVQKPTTPIPQQPSVEKPVASTPQPSVEEPEVQKPVAPISKPEQQPTDQELIDRIFKGFSFELVDENSLETEVSIFSYEPSRKSFRRVLAQAVYKILEATAKEKNVEKTRKLLQEFEEEYPQNLHDVAKGVSDLVELLQKKNISAALDEIKGIADSYLREQQYVDLIFKKFSRRPVDEKTPDMEMLAYDLLNAVKMRNAEEVKFFLWEFQEDYPHNIPVVARGVFDLAELLQKNGSVDLALSKIKEIALSYLVDSKGNLRVERRFERSLPGTRPSQTPQETSTPLWKHLLLGWLFATGAALDGCRHLKRTPAPVHDVEMPPEWLIAGKVPPGDPILEHLHKDYAQQWNTGICPAPQMSRALVAKPTAEFSMGKPYFVPISPLSAQEGVSEEFLPKPLQLFRSFEFYPEKINATKPEKVPSLYGSCLAEKATANVTQQQPSLYGTCSEQLPTNGTCPNQKIVEMPQGNSQCLPSEEPWRHYFGVKWRGFSNTLKGWASEEAADEAFDAAGNVWEGTKNWASEKAAAGRDAAFDAAGNAWKATKDWAGEKAIAGRDAVFDAAGNVWEGTKSWASEKAAASRDAAFDAAGNAWKATKDWAGEKAIAGRDGIFDAAGNAWEAIRSAYHREEEIVKSPSPQPSIQKREVSFLNQTLPLQPKPFVEKEAPFFNQTFPKCSSAESASPKKNFLWKGQPTQNHTEMSKALVLKASVKKLEPPRVKALPQPIQNGTKSASLYGTCEEPLNNATGFCPNPNYLPEEEICKRESVSQPQQPKVPFANSNEGLWMKCGVVGAILTTLGFVLRGFRKEQEGVLAVGSSSGEGVSLTPGALYFIEREERPSETKEQESQTESPRRSRRARRQTEFFGYPSSPEKCPSYLRCTSDSD